MSYNPTLSWYVNGERASGSPSLPPTPVGVLNRPLKQLLDNTDYLLTEVNYIQSLIGPGFGTPGAFAWTPGFTKAYPVIVVGSDQKLYSLKISGSSLNDPTVSPADWDGPFPFAQQYPLAAVGTKGMIEFASDADAKTTLPDLALSPKSLILAQIRNYIVDPINGTSAGGVDGKTFNTLNNAILYAPSGGSTRIVLLDNIDISLSPISIINKNIEIVSDGNFDPVPQVIEFVLTVNTDPLTVAEQLDIEGDLINFSIGDTPAIIGSTIANHLFTYPYVNYAYYVLSSPTTVTVGIVYSDTAGNITPSVSVTPGTDITLGPINIIQAYVPPPYNVAPTRLIYRNFNSSSYIEVSNGTLSLGSLALEYNAGNNSDTRKRAMIVLNGNATLNLQHKNPDLFWSTVNADPNDYRYSCTVSCIGGGSNFISSLTGSNALNDPFCFYTGNGQDLVFGGPDGGVLAYTPYRRNLNYTVAESFNMPFQGLNFPIGLTCIQLNFLQVTTSFINSELTLASGDSIDNTWQWIGSTCQTWTHKITAPAGTLTLGIPFNQADINCRIWNFDGSAQANLTLAAGSGGTTFLADITGGTWYIAIQPQVQNGNNLGSITQAAISFV